MHQFLFFIFVIPRLFMVLVCSYIFMFFHDLILLIALIPYTEIIFEGDDLSRIGLSQIVKHLY